MLHLAFSVRAAVLASGLPRRLAFAVGAVVAFLDGFEVFAFCLPFRAGDTAATEREEVGREGEVGGLMRIWRT